MAAYSEHLDKIQYIKNSLENEIVWLRSVFFDDVFNDISLVDLVEKHNKPLIKIWFEGTGRELTNKKFLKKSDSAIWELNRLNEESKEVQEQNLTYVMLRTKCPKEIVQEIMRAMDIVYMFCGIKEYDSTDPECVRRYCNIYMADHVYNSNDLFNKLMVPVNEIVNMLKSELKKD